MLGLVWYFISNFCILFHLISQRDTVSIIKLTLWYWTQRDTVSIIKLDTLILNREILSVSSNLTLWYWTQRDTVSIIKLDTLILNTERYCQYHQTWHSDTEHFWTVRYQTYDVTDINNNINFEGLDKHFH